MGGTLGLSFMPGADTGDGEADLAKGATPIQSAIKLLSLRLPSVVGAQAITPQALLEARGGQGIDTLALLRRLLQRDIGTTNTSPDGRVTIPGHPTPPPRVTPQAPPRPAGPMGGVPQAPMGGGESPSFPRRPPGTAEDTRVFPF